MHDLQESLLNSALDYVTTPLLNVYVYVSSSMQILTLTAPSLPPVLLSRFIINLRQVDSPSTNPSVNQRSSRFSIPNFHMPNMDDVVGNLGGCVHHPLGILDGGLRSFPGSAGRYFRDLPRRGFG